MSVTDVNVPKARNYIEKIQKYKQYYTNKQYDFSRPSYYGHSYDLNRYLAKIYKKYQDITANLDNIKNYVEEYVDDVEAVEKLSIGETGSIHDIDVKTKVINYKDVLKSFKMQDNRLFQNAKQVTTIADVVTQSIWGFNSKKDTKTSENNNVKKETIAEEANLTSASVSKNTVKPEKTHTNRTTGNATTTETLNSTVSKETENTVENIAPPAETTPENTTTTPVFSEEEIRKANSEQALKNIEEAILAMISRNPRLGDILESVKKGEVVDLTKEQKKVQNDYNRVKELYDMYNETYPEYKIETYVDKPTAETPIPEEPINEQVQESFSKESLQQATSLLAALVGTPGLRAMLSALQLGLNIDLKDVPLEAQNALKKVQEICKEKGMSLQEVLNNSLQETNIYESSANITRLEADADFLEYTDEIEIYPLAFFSVNNEYFVDKNISLVQYLNRIDAKIDNYPDLSNGLFDLEFDEPLPVIACLLYTKGRELRRQPDINPELAENITSCESFDENNDVVIEDLEKLEELVSPYLTDNEKRYIDILKNTSNSETA